MTSRQYKHQQDRLQKGWSKVHVMLDPDASANLRFLEDQGYNKTEAVVAALRELRRRFP